MTDAKQYPPGKSTHTRGSAWKWIGLATAAVAIACVGGWYYHTREAQAAHGSPGASQDSPKSESPDEPIPVETVHPSKGGITRFSAQIGSVHPFEEADLYAKVSGYLAKLLVDYGDHVKRDQLLAEIDVPEIVEDEVKAAADVAQAKAAVTQAEAFIEAAKADRDAQGSAVEQATAEVDRYKSMRVYHEKKVARYRDLVAKKAIPQEILDEEEESYDSARASELASQKAVLHAKAQLLAAAARVKKSEADLVEAKANVGVAEAKHARAKVFVGYTKITSPYDGVITKRNFFRGAFIRSAAEGGTLPLLTVARIDKVRVVTKVPDRDVPFTNVGDVAEITLDALGSQVFKGKVSRFSEAEDPTSRTMHTEIDLDNPEGIFRPGMYGIARIVLDTSIKASTIPASCLVGEARDGLADVFIVKNGKAKKVQIKIGADDGLRVEVLSGITAHDDVIVNTGSVTDGAPVRVTRVVAAR
jgi:RND family efflux transporter MFP subunit